MDMVIQSKYVYQPHTETLTHAMTQPSEDIILARNAELRKNPGSVQDLGSQKAGAGGTWGRYLAEIPELMLYKAVHQDGFDIHSKDKEFGQRELMRFLATSEGQKCIVMDTSAKSNTKYFKGI